MFDRFNRHQHIICQNEGVIQDYNKSFKCKWQFPNSYILFTHDRDSDHPIRISKRKRLVPVLLKLFFYRKITLTKNLFRENNLSQI